MGNDEYQFISVLGKGIGNLLCKFKKQKTSYKQ